MHDTISSNLWPEYKYEDKLIKTKHSIDKPHRVQRQDLQDLVSVLFRNFDTLKLYDPNMNRKMVLR